MEVCPSVNKKTWHKAPGAPKRPLSAYNCFFADMRQQIREEYDGTPVGFSTLAKIVSMRWHTIPDDVKQHYLDKAKESREHYDELKLEWETTKAYRETITLRKAKKRVTRAKYRARLKLAREKPKTSHIEEAIDINECITIPPRFEDEQENVQNLVQLTLKDSGNTVVARSNTRCGENWHMSQSHPRWNVSGLDTSRSEMNLHGRIATTNDNAIANMYDIYKGVGTPGYHRYSFDPYNGCCQQEENAFRCDTSSAFQSPSKNYRSNISALLDRVVAVDRFATASDAHQDLQATTTSHNKPHVAPITTSTNTSNQVQKKQITIGEYPPCTNDSRYLLQAQRMHTTVPTRVPVTPRTNTMDAQDVRYDEQLINRSLHNIRFLRVSNQRDTKSLAVPFDCRADFDSTSSSSLKAPGCNAMHPNSSRDNELFQYVFHDDEEEALVGNVFDGDDANNC